MFLSCFIQQGQSYYLARIFLILSMHMSISRVHKKNSCCEGVININFWESIHYLTSCRYSLVNVDF